jgi:phage-related holin
MKNVLIMVRVMNDWAARFLDWIYNVLFDTYNCCFALAVSFLGYMLPIKNAIHLILFFFFLDVLFGVWAAKKVRKERFKTAIIWQKTIPRAFISIIIIMAAYMWDTVFEQSWIQTYMVIGWFISGVLLLSITKNAAELTKWSGFTAIGNIIKKEVKEKTDQDVEKHA